MSRRIKTPADLRWLLAHTDGFKGGQVSDVHVRKQRLLDECSGREISAGTTITIVIRYEHIPEGLDPEFSISRVAKLTMRGATDFSVFEQEGADFSEIGLLHAEATGGRLRFWFDPHGELYVICEEVELDEVSRPGTGLMRAGTSEWTFQAQGADLPDVAWFLEQLDRAGIPCAWRAAKPSTFTHRAVRWAGTLIPAVDGHATRTGGVLVQTYGAMDQSSFGITLRASDPHEGPTGRLLVILADIIARTFSGLCLAKNQILDRDEWLAR